jgi:hypothetical protein
VLQKEPDRPRQAPSLWLAAAWSRQSLDIRMHFHAQSRTPEATPDHSVLPVMTLPPASGYTNLLYQRNLARITQPLPRRLLYHTQDPTRTFRYYITMYQLLYQLKMCYDRLMQTRNSGSDMPSVGL